MCPTLYFVPWGGQGQEAVVCPESLATKWCSPEPWPCVCISETATCASGRGLDRESEGPGLLCDLSQPCAPGVLDLSRAHQYRPCLPLGVLCTPEMLVPRGLALLLMTILLAPTSHCQCPAPATLSPPRGEVRHDTRAGLCAVGGCWEL